MLSVWTRHLKNEEEKKTFQSKINSSKPVLDRLREYLIEEDEVLTQGELSQDTFQDSSWAYKQAFINGDRSRLRKILRLVDLDQQRN